MHTTLLSISYQALQGNNLFIDLIAGATAGILVALLMQKKGIDMLICIVFGLIGGWIAESFFSSVFNFTKNRLVNVIIGATIGALVLSIIFSLIFGAGKKGRDRSKYQS